MHISCTIDISIKYFAHHQHFTTNNNIHLKYRIKTNILSNKTNSETLFIKSKSSFIPMPCHIKYTMQQSAHESREKPEKKETKININTVHILAFMWVLCTFHAYAYAVRAAFTYAFSEIISILIELAGCAIYEMKKWKGKRITTCCSTVRFSSVFVYIRID